MTEERVDIVIGDKISDEPAKKIKLIATNAVAAHEAVKLLREAIGGINSGAVAKLQKEMASAAIDTARQASAYERLQAAQARTATAVARLERAQAQANAATGQASVVQQRLATETQRTENATLRAATARERLTQVTERGIAAMDREGAAAAAALKQIETARAKQAALNAQSAYNDLLGVNAGTPKSARSSMSVFQEDARAKALAAKETENLERRSQALMAAVDPLIAAQRTYNNVVKEANTLLAAGGITQQQHAQAINVATQALQQHTGVQQQAAKAVGLTRFQVLTLQYTMNDIAASLASGTSPFTILMQQGGQVTQAWGGLGATLRAAGSAIVTTTGLIVSGAVAVAGAVLLWDQANASIKSVQRQLDLTAGSAGMTASEVVNMSLRIGEATRQSSGSAREVMLAYAATGQLQRTEIEQLTAATLNFARLSDQSADKVVKQWDSMAEGPAKFAKSMLQHYGTFSAAEVEHIKLLEDTGRKSQATAEVAQKLFEVYGKTAPENLSLAAAAFGELERAAMRAWEAVKRAVTAPTLQQEIASTEATIKRLEALTNPSSQRATVGGGTFGDQRLDAQKELDIARAKLTVMQEGAKIQGKIVADKAIETKLQKEGSDAIAKLDSYSASIADNSARAAREIEGFRNELEKARKVDPNGAVYLNSLENQAKIEAGIRKKWMPEAARDAKKAEAEYERLELAIERVFGNLDKESNALGLLSVEREKANKLAEIDIQLAAKKFKLNPKERQDAIELIDNIENQKRSQQALDRVNEAAVGPLQTYQANVRAITALLNAESISQAEATRQAVIARETYLNATSPMYAINKALTQEAALLGLVGDEKEVATKMQQFENKLLADGFELNSAAMKVAKEQLELTVRTNVERGKMQSLLEGFYQKGPGAIKDLAREETALTEAFNRGYIGLDQYRMGLFDVAASLAQVRIEMGQGSFADAMLVSVKKNFQGIEDALLDLVTKGKADWRSLITAMIREALRLSVIRPLMNAALGMFGLSSGTGGAAGAGGAAGGGVLGAIQTGSSLSTLIGAGSQFLYGGSAGASAASLGYANMVGAVGGDSLGALVTANGGWAGVSAGATSGAASVAGADAIGAGMASVAEGAAIDAAIAGTAVEAGAAAGAAAGSAAVTGALAAIPVVGWVALFAIAAYSIFGGKSHGPKSDGGAGTILSDIGKFDRSPATDSIAQNALVGLTGQYATLLNTLGGKESGVTFGVGFSTDPKGTSPTFVEADASKGGAGIYNGVDLNVGRSQEELTAAIALQSSRAILAGLKASDLPARMAEFFESLGDPAQLTLDQLTAAFTAATQSKQVTDSFALLGPAFDHLANMSVRATQGVIAAGGGFEMFSKNLSAYYDNFYTAEEKRRNTAEHISKALGSVGFNVTTDQVMNATREQFRQAVELFAALGEGGQPVVNALIGVNQEFASITQNLDDASGSIGAFLQNLKDDAKQLQVELLRAGGDNTGADALQRQYDTATFTAVELAQYNYNQRLRDQIKLLNEAAAVAEQRHGLEAQIFTLTKNTTALRKRELDALDPANRALQRYIYLLQDVATAQDAATKAHATLDSASANVVSVYQSQIQALDSQAQAQQQVIDGTQKMTNTLLDFRDSLKLDSALSPLTPKETYAEAYRQLDAAKSSGDDEAIKSAAQQFLQASRVYNASGGNYENDFNTVQSILTDAGARSAAQAANTRADAQSQLAAIQASKELLQQQFTATGLIVDNTAPLDKAIKDYQDALLEAQDADAALAKAQADVAIAAAQNSAALQLAATQSTADNTYAILQAIVAQANSVGTTSPGLTTADYINIGTTAGSNEGIYDQVRAGGGTLAALDVAMGWAPMTAEDWAVANGRQVFAAGGAFTNGIVSTPTDFNIGQMGEAGYSEGILPLANIDGMLGVHASGMPDNSQLVAMIAELIAEVNDLKEQEQESARYIATVIAQSSSRSAERIVKGGDERSQRNEFVTRRTANARIAVKS